VIALPFLFAFSTAVLMSTRSLLLLAFLVVGCDSHTSPGLPGAQRCVRICRLEGSECPTAEGRCVAQRHSPEGTGFCTVDTLTGR
jgi:hypothetical protein